MRQYNFNLKVFLDVSTLEKFYFIATLHAYNSSLTNLMTNQKAFPSITASGIYCMFAVWTDTEIDWCAAVALLFCLVSSCSNEKV